VSGVTAFDCADAVPSPLALIACTTKRYVVPLVSPEIEAVVSAAVPWTVVGVCGVAPM
jgi:hypothetical protein